LFNTKYVLGALTRIPHPVHGVALTGGEPFSSPKILEIKKELEANGYRVFAITNGTLHDQVNEFLSGDTLDIALSVHNPALFPEWIVAKKQALIDTCRDCNVKMMAGLFSVDNDDDIRMAVENILLNRDVFHTATISTVYRKDVPAMGMDDLMDKVAALLPGAYSDFSSPWKASVVSEGFNITLKCTPTKEEYWSNVEAKTPGCLFLCCTGEFLPVAEAQYINEERLR
jgi:hypothetical protein